MGLNAGRRGAAIAALCAAVAVATPAVSGTLTVRTGTSELASLPLADGATWCLAWNHSVTGGPVADCFVARDGALILERSYLHDFAAGLGEVAGRGTVRPASGGGYWIEDIDEPVGTLVLRIGRPSTDHRIVAPDRIVELSALAPGTRATISIAR